jgi:hypothetical protein
MLGLMGPNKKVATIIVGSSEKKSEEKEVDLEKEAQLDAAKQFLQAVEKKDAQAIVDSFKGLMECCEMESESESEEDKD